MVDRSLTGICKKIHRKAGIRRWIKIRGYGRREIGMGIVAVIKEEGSDALGGS